MPAWRVWILYVATVAAVTYAWQLRRRGAPTAAIAWFLAAATLFVGIGAATEVRWQHDEHRYTVAANTITGTGPNVRCQRLTESLLDFDGNAGFVRSDGDGVISDTANVDRNICVDLRNLPRRAADASRNQIVALHVLAHEAQHLAGIEDEAKADCYATQRSADVGAALGIPRDQGHLYGLRYLTDIYPNMPDEYRNAAACTAGGEYDRHIPGFVWPAN